MINRDYSLKQHKTIEYLGCYLDSDLNGESMARSVLKKFNTKLNLLLRQSNYLNYLSRRLFYNALIQAHFHYGCKSWSIFSKQVHMFLSDCNGTRTHNHLVRKRTLNH